MQRCCFFIPAFAVLICQLAGCLTSQNQETDAVPPEKSNKIVAVSYALQFLTTRIAGDEFAVEFPAEQSADPRKWNPSPDQIAAMQTADLIVINGQGAEYAQWIVRTTLPASRICHSCEDMKLREQISVPDHRIVHSHGPEGEHSHPYMVPYTWLDPAMAIKQAEKIAECLSKTYPDSANKFKSNLDTLTDELEAILTEIPEPTDPPATVISLNPHLKYLTRAAGLQDVHLLWFDINDIGIWQKRKEEFEERKSATNTNLVLTTDKLPENVASYLADQGMEVIKIDALDLEPASGDFMTALRSNLQRLR